MNEILCDIVDLAEKNRIKAEIFSNRVRSKALTFNNDKVEEINYEERTDYYIRVIKDGKIGFYSAMNFLDIESAIKKSLNSSEFGEKVRFDFPMVDEFIYPKTYDTRLMQLMDQETAKLAGICEGFVHTLRLLNRQISCNLSLEIGETVTSIANTSGFFCSYKKSGFYLASWVKGFIDDRLVQHFDLLRSRKQEDLSRFAEQIVKELYWSENLVNVKTGDYKMLFMPSVSKVLFQGFLAMVNGGAVLKQESLLENRLGEKIFDNRLSITDDCSADWLLGSIPFDDEGVKASSKPIIEEGLFNNFLYDLKTGALAGTGSTGNGKRYEGKIRIAANNLLVGEGCLTLDDLIKEIDEGILVGTGMGSLDMNGNFNIVVENGYLISGGEIAGKIDNNLQVIGNIFNAFNSIMNISKERISSGSMLLPYIGFERLSLQAN